MPPTDERSYRRFLTGLAIAAAATWIAVFLFASVSAQELPPKILRYNVVPRIVQSDVYGIAQQMIQVRVRTRGGHSIAVTLENPNERRESARPVRDYEQTFWFRQVRAGVYHVTIDLLDQHEEVIEHASAGTVEVVR